MKLSGSQIVLECLKEKGVDTLFGYPGGAVIPLYDALYDELDHFNHYRTAHEQSAVHAADAYARTTGKVGVAIATSGPGATNTITGIATAYMDSVPLVVITGQVPNILLGKDSFQEIDITGATLSITKHNYLVRNIENLADVIREAINVAKEGRPGPVLVDIPKDVFLTKYEYEKQTNKESEEKIIKPKEDLFKKAAELFNSSKKPVIYAGGGVRISKTDNLLLNLAEKGDIPTSNSLMGLGTIPREHRLSLGMVGMHGHKETNLAITECDLLIAIGARFSDRVIGKPDQFAADAQIIHIDIDGTEIDKNTENCIPLIGDMKYILTKLIDGIDKKDRNDWIEKIQSMKVEKVGEPIFEPEDILDKVNDYYNNDTVVVTDVGQHQMWTGQYWRFKKSSEFATSGGLGTMGYGLGALIGAQIGNPKKNAVLITGDGSFRMTCNELVTIARYKLPVTILLFNNNTLGMVRQWQRMFSNKRYSETDIYDDVNYQKLTDAYGIKGYKAENLNQLESILNKVKDKREPVLIECKIDHDCSVYPIVPPGRPIDELLLNG